MKTIDFHTHILPSIDDGASDINISLKMLDEYANQSINYIVATSHYYSDYESPTEFVNRRNEAFDKLAVVLNKSHPTILSGAEVLYFPGISKSDDIGLLTIENTNTLLLEMPFRDWNNSVLDEVIELNRRFNVVIAHIDRYLKFSEKSAFSLLADNNIAFQINTDAFSGYFKKRKIFHLMTLGNKIVLGSDCHNVTTRPPELQSGISKIEKHFGNEMLKKIRDDSLELLCINENEV